MEVRKKIVVTVDGYRAVRRKVLAVLDADKAAEKLAEVCAYIDWHKNTCNMEVEAELNYLNCLCYDDCIKVTMEDTTEAERECSISTEEFLLGFPNMI
jgi:hypothetical protein